MLERLPPLLERRKRVVPRTAARMDLDLHLPDRERRRGRRMWVRLRAMRRRRKLAEERSKRCKLSALDVNLCDGDQCVRCVATTATHLQKVNEAVPVERHECRERVRRRVRACAVAVAVAEGVREEMRASVERRVCGNLRAERGDTKVVAPHLAAGCGAQQRGLEGRLVVHTEGVDHAVRLPRDALESANPLAAVAQCADALDAVRTLVGRDEEVPWTRVSGVEADARADSQSV